MKKLSDETRKVLLQAGWNPAEKLELTETINFLKEMGYEVYEPIIEALSQFGRFEYKYKHPDGSWETFLFSPEEAVGDYYEKKDFEEFEIRVKEPLVVVGEAYRGNIILFISKSGKVFGENGSSLFKLGDDIYEALNTLCLFRKPEKFN
ncbi:hypothetical protein PAECIP112173_01925 [Paenibacillus sp. JJ-100]|uniref:SUKH-3 domain-containing protein n=1 Tax=Paenibacillus sp. JJ-100 TaxID=2974896 RepID=UPI0022FF5B4A|nr:SUKH-3 domain-containing protein [Paenibacillus sp. JJ-100]CAI6064513.1 hypothetical protein PAECIP112173_01925 [Paenibacillus sp. JJ-100]